MKKPLNKYLIVYGTRPQIIKVNTLMRSCPDTIRERLFLLNTGQHYSEELTTSQNYKDNYVYDFENGSWGELLDTIINVVRINNIKKLMVIGDTNSTLIGAVAGSVSNLDVIHIESGLRSNALNMPEERNRRAVDSLSSILFCVNEESNNNLYNEKNIGKSLITGDLMQEEFQFNYHNIKRKRNKSQVLLTIHRKENKTKKSIKSLRDIIEYNTHLNFVWPAHPSMKIFIENLEMDKLPNLIILQPMDYLQLLNTLKESEFVFTDSGGVQREAYWAGKYCFIARNETEWIDIVKAGHGELLPLTEDSTVLKLNPKNIPQKRDKAVEASKLIWDFILKENS